MILIVVKVIVAVVLIWWVLLYTQQSKMMFPAGMARVVPNPVLPERTEVLQRPIDQGHVEAWLVSSPQATEQEPAPLVVFFHGNAETIDDQDFILAGYQRMGVNVLIVGYRGYGRSAGHPSQAALVDDAAHFIDLAVQQPFVDAGRLVYHGRSLGGAVATQAVTRRKPAALILESTFYSGAAMAHRVYAPGFLMKSPFATHRVVAEFDGPILLFHGENDIQIPSTHSQWLRDIAKDARLITYPMSHNFFPGNAHMTAYWEEIGAFLREKNVMAPTD